MNTNLFINLLVPIIGLFLAAFAVAKGIQTGTSKGWQYARSHFAFGVAIAALVLTTRTHGWTTPTLAIIGALAMILALVFQTKERAAPLH